MKKISSYGLTENQIKEMFAVAKKTRDFAFSHRSMHKIGASVLTADGNIYGGCNIESVISGLGTCAERCAVNNAVAHGHYDIVAVCTVDSGFTPTCGACLQYIMLFSQVSGKDIVLINGDIKGNYEFALLSDLLPQGYRTQNNLEVITSYSKAKVSDKAIISHKEKKKLGKKIRELRKAKGYSQEVFASKCKVHKTHMSLIENGKMNVTSDTLQTIAEQLELAISDLIELI